MHDTAGVFLGHMNGAVDSESGRIDAIAVVGHDITGLIDFHQRRRRDFMEHHAIGVYQKTMISPWQSCGQMRKNQVIPAKVSHQSVGCRQIDANLPLFRVDMVRTGICVHLDFGSHVGSGSVRGDKASLLPAPPLVSTCGALGMFVYCQTESRQSSG
jgi:hypothetical protein